MKFFKKLLHRKPSMKSILCTYLLSPLFICTSNGEAQSNIAKPNKKSLCTSITSTETFSEHNCSGLNIIQVRGTPLNRAKILGRELKAKRNDAPVISYFANIVSENMKRIPLGDSLLKQIVDRRAPRWPLFNELKAWAAEAHIDSAVLGRAVLAPDLASASSLVTTQVGTPQFGCSSFAERRGQETIIGRNLDFSGVGVFESRPTIYLHQPTQLGEWAHLSFSTEDLFFASVTGLNEKGIYLSVHQNFTHDQSMDGIPLYMVGELVLRSAESLNDAETLLKAYRPFGLWTFNLSDLKTGESAVVEVSVNSFSVRRGQRMTQANHMNLANERQSMTFSKIWHSQRRQKTLQEDLESLQSTEQASNADYRKLLLTGLKGSGAIEPGQSVGAPETISSIFLRAPIGNWKKGHLAMATGGAPVSGNQYIELSLAELFAPSKNMLHEVLPALGDRHQKQNQAWAKAYSSYFSGRDNTAAAQALADVNAPLARLFAAAHHTLAKNYLAADAELNKLKEADFNKLVPHHQDSLIFLRVQLDVLLARTHSSDLLSTLKTHSFANDAAKRNTHKLTHWSRLGRKKLRLTAVDYFSGDLVTRN